MEKIKQIRTHRKRFTSLPVWVIVSKEGGQGGWCSAKIVGVFTKEIDAKLICEELNDSQWAEEFEVFPVSAMDVIQGEFKVNYPQT